MLSTPRTPILSLDSFALRGSIAKPRLHIKSGASKWGFLEQGSCKKNIKEKHPKDPKGPLIRGCIIRGFLAKKSLLSPNTPTTSRSLKRVASWALGHKPCSIIFLPLNLLQTLARPAFWQALPALRPVNTPMKIQIGNMVLRTCCGNRQTSFDQLYCITA